jgi:ribosome-associated heat shock protein Hsp15
MADDAMRLDRFLWFVRLAKTRSLAQQIAATGRLRCDGRLLDKPAASVRVGNVLTFAQGDRVRTLRVEALPHRRGPATEAQTCYTELTVSSGAGGKEASAPANVSQQAPAD